MWLKDALKSKALGKAWRIIRSMSAASSCACARRSTASSLQAAKPYGFNSRQKPAWSCQQKRESNDMKLRRLYKNELTTLFTQERSHEQFFDNEVHGCGSEPQLPEAARQHLARWHMPELGFRNYWYPVMLASDLAKRPVRRRLLGEDIAFWRDGGKVNAIADRCLHRGASLSRGHIRFPGSGTLSCPYHGWTYDGQGQLRACIQEGPNSVMPGKVKTKAYPVEERLNVIWVWIGDMDPVPVEDDLPLAMKV